MRKEWPTKPDRIVITGASGYLGRGIAEAFQRQGTQVVSLGRSQPQHVSVHRHITWSFENPELKDLAGATVLIHCAWDMGISEAESNTALNVDGTRRLFDSAYRMGVEQLVFISTTSAFSTAKTIYGKSKWMLEEWLKPMGVMIVRPGLIYGTPAGSMFRALQRIVRSLPIIPVFGVNKRFYMSHRDDLISGIVGLVTGQWSYDPSHPVLASSEPVRFGDILQRVARDEQLRRLFIPVPWNPIYWAMKAAEKSGARLPFKSDSLLSLMTLPQNLPVNLQIPFRSFSCSDADNFL